MQTAVPAVRRQLAQPEVLNAIICVVLATGLAIAAHVIDDRLLPAGADRSNDLTLSYVDLIAGGVVLLATTVSAGALRDAISHTLTAIVGAFCLLIATGRFALTAIGDVIGFDHRPCAYREVEDIYNNLCVPSPLADQIQLPLHIGVVVFLLLAMVLTVVGDRNKSAAPRRELFQRAMAEPVDGAEMDAQEK